MASQDTRSAVEHSKKQQQQVDIERRKSQITELIDKCSRALGRGGDPHERGGADYYVHVDRACRDGVGSKPPLADLLREFGNYPDLMGYDSDLAGHEWWHPIALDRLLDGWHRPFEGHDVTHRQLVADAFHSLAAIAEAEGIVADELSNRVDVVGFAGKTGEALQPYDMDIGDPVQWNTLQSGALKTLHIGGTGQGKSAGLETDVWDYYRQNWQDGLDYKIIDVVGPRDGENWCYDIPQQQDALRRAREQKDLPADFTQLGEADDRADHDGSEADEVSTTLTDDRVEPIEPKIEILHPLIPGLSEKALPYDEDLGEFRVTPYTVPAANLDKSLLISLILSRVSPEQENIIRQAYDDVDEQHADWSLKDLAEEITMREELGRKHKQSAIGVLRSLANEGFIRTREDPNTLDWDRIFNEPRTITVFSQAFFEDDIGTFAAMAHVIDAIVRERQKPAHYPMPDAVLVCREFWKITPHQRRQEPDARVAAIQEAMGARMQKLLRENRHFDTHIIGDTQKPGDLLKSVREMFNRYVVYSASRTACQNVFDWTQNDKWQSFYNTLTAETGVAGVVGQVQPAIDHREIEYLSPVEVVPAPFHHYDDDHDPTGWYMRNEYLGEDLRRPADLEGIDWGDQQPDDLEIDSAKRPDPDSDESPDPNLHPMAAFVDECIEETGQSNHWVPTADVRMAYNQWAEDNDIETIDSASVFGRRFSDGLRMELDKQNRNGEKAYIGLVFTESGEEYYQNHPDAIYAD